MVLVEGHLVDMAEDAPVDEVGDETRQSCDSIALNLIEGLVDVLLADLLRSVVKRLTKMVR